MIFMSDTVGTTHFRFWLWLIRLIGVIVPQRLRADWKQEWEAELQHREQMLAQWDRLDWRSKLDLMRRSTSAFWDALWMQTYRWEDAMIQDLRFAVRMLVKRPLITFISIFTLALGIGANTAIFIWLKAIFLHPLPGVVASERLVTLHSVRTRSAASISYPDYKDYRDRNEVFSGLTVSTLETFNLLEGTGRPERVFGSMVSGNYFDVLGVRMRLGRSFAPEEDRTPGTHPVVVISHKLWQARFASEPAIIGKTIKLNQRDFTIIGVAAADFSGGYPGLALDLWVPVMMSPQITVRGDRLNERDTQWLFALGRLKDGVAFKQAQANVQTIAAQLAKDYPKTNEGLGATLFTLVSEPDSVGSMLPVLAVLMIVAGLVLVVACANVANLLLARAAGRSRELGIRTALGASRLRLIRQILTESLLLAGLGGAAGMLLALWLSNAMSWLLPPLEVPLSLNLAWDYRVSSFALALTAGTVIAVGLAPALRATKVDPIVSLRGEPGAIGALSRRSRLRGALVVSQIAVSLVSLICAGLFIRSLAHERRINLGFDPERALLVSMDLFPNGYDEKRSAEFYRQLVASVAALPGVQGVSLSNRVPPTLFTSNMSSFEMEGYTPLADELISIEFEVVAPRYFQTMRIPLVAGREFSEADREKSPPVVMVNETLARRYWAGQSPVGKRLRSGSGAWHTVIGVARDVKHFGPTEPVQPWIYYPHAQQSNRQMTLVVRTAGDPRLALPSVRGAVAALDATLPLFDEKTLQTHSGVSLFLDRMAVIFLSAFGLLALALASIGLYGVLAYAVTARTHEIGIRMALGAEARDVLRLVIGQGMRLTFVGMAIGLGGALALTRLLKTLLFGISATDPLTLSLIAVLLLVVAWLACFIPARRATKVDPMVAFRHE
jgi:predicted permease